MEKKKTDMDYIAMIYENLKIRGIDPTIKEIVSHPLFQKVKNKEAFLSKLDRAIAVRVHEDNEHRINVETYGIPLDINNKENRMMLNEAIRTFIRNVEFIVKCRNITVVKTSKGVSKMSNFRDWFKSRFGKSFLN